MSNVHILNMLKLPSLFAAWLFWTCHTKSHNMKALVILNHSWSPFLPLICLYGKKITFVGLFVAFWSIFLRKKLFSDYPCISHDHDHQWANFVQSDYRKTRENVNITLLDLCMFTFYSVHASESTWRWL